MADTAGGTAGADRIIDISPPLSPRIAVWPGDRPFESIWTMRLRDGDSCNAGALSMSAHTGAHADAPYHFLEDGARIDAVPMESYIGECVVLDVRGEERLTMALLERLAWRDAPRALFRSRDRVDPERFPERFFHLTAEAAIQMAAAGVRLVGMDTPSVDAFTSKTLDAHKALLRGGVAILEGLDLSRVEPGRYELIAPPLRLEGMDASPVRAVLRRK